MTLSGDVPDSKVHGANMGPIWGRQDQVGPHVGPMNFAIWGGTAKLTLITMRHLQQLAGIKHKTHMNWKLTHKPSRPVDAPNLIPSLRKHR